MRGRFAAGFVVLCVAGLLVWNYLRPYPPAIAALELPVEQTVAGAQPDLPWPGTGAAAIGASGLGAIASSGNEQTLPAASVTKVMTAVLPVVPMVTLKRQRFRTALRTWPTCSSRQLPCLPRRAPLVPLRR